MLRFLLETPVQQELVVLCLGAHGDDIEIGCGGTLLKLLDRYENVSCRWVVFSGGGERQRECEASAARFLERARERSVEVMRFRDGFMPQEWGVIKERFERLKGEVSPTVIFTHYLHDRHQDHRLIAELTWNTFRDHLVLEYEVPKYDGDLGQPNVFSVLDEGESRRKIDFLLGSYDTQQTRRWFSEETFWAMLRLRGIEAGAESGYAEAFYGRKLVL